MSEPAEPNFIPYRPFDPGIDAETASNNFHAWLHKRRSVRHFSNRPVSRETIDNLIRAAGTAPSGANKQPWRFVAIDDPALKREIRLAAEEEERQFYEHRASERWLADLAPLGTTSEKPFLETAPWLVVVFRLTREDPSDQASNQLYYVNESVGIACGFLLAAAQAAGLATLTHTPSPMQFLAKILGRPANERPYLLVPVGYPAEDCTVPAIERKALEEIRVVNRPQDPPPKSS
ncbi:MAG: nitroreductase family protein [Phycisphaerales bacterium]|nr:nitroreductase family protein [Phycisphaerales bacterium]